jgi:pilus assembly protein FimV
MGSIVKITIIKQIFLVLCFALLPLTSSATGLGKLNVLSALGEPLNAEIELLSATPEELAALTVSLASEELYAAQGLNKTAIQQTIKAVVTKKPNGTNVIQLSSSQAVTDPFLDMLIQVTWSDGQLSREYTLLLDPPEYSVANVTPPVVDTPKKIVERSIAKTAQEQPIKEFTPREKIRSKPAQVADKTQNDNVVQGQPITTVKGDSLSAIAKTIQVPGVNLDQMLVGLYKANPSAFESENMNRLKVGQVMNIPSAEVFQEINKDAAKSEVRAQVANWHSYTSKLAEMVSRSEVTDNLSGNQSAGKITAKAEDKAAPLAEGPRDVVKLAKTESAKTTDVDGKQNALSKKDAEQVKSTLQDDLTASENTIKETDERSAALEKQIADMKKLLAVKNKTMADAQKNADQSKQKTVEAPAIWNVIDPFLLAVIGGSLITLTLLWLWLRRKNKTRILPQDIFTIKDDALDYASESASSNTSFLNDFSSDAGSLIDTHEVDPIAEAEVFLSYGRHAQAEDILKDAIQKSPERYELHLKLLTLYAESSNVSAFELLAVELFSQLGSNSPIWSQVSELGLKVDPDNKLYHRAKDANAAVVTKTDNLSASDFNDAELMDEQYEPNQSLEPLIFEEREFGAAQSESESESAVELAPLNFNPVSDITDASVSKAHFDADKELQEVEEINFDVSESMAPDDVNTPPIQVVEEINFDVSETMASDEANTPPIQAVEIDLTAINLNFESIQLDPIEVPSTPIPDAFSGDFSNLLKVDIKPQAKKTVKKLSEDQTEPDLNDTEFVTTKLELATAYIDMADKEGALELLNEVLQEGSSAQRDRAQELIDSLS